MANLWDWDPFSPFWPSPSDIVIAFIAYCELRTACTAYPAYIAYLDILDLTRVDPFSLRGPGKAG